MASRPSTQIASSLAFPFQIKTFWQRCEAKLESALLVGQEADTEYGNAGGGHLEMYRGCFKLKHNLRLAEHRKWPAICEPFNYAIHDKMASLEWLVSMCVRVSVCARVWN